MIGRHPRSLAKVVTVNADSQNPDRDAEPRAGNPEDVAWRERRDLAITRHAEALARSRATETAQARQLVAEFAAAARDRGLRTTRLVARAYNGRSRYRTSLVGWYVHPDRSMAIGVDGEFYLLGVPASLRARLLGATVRPHEPMPIIGRGARDGESISLRELLHRRLAAGDGTQ
jgi:hypothetical protein